MIFLSLFFWYLPSAPQNRKRSLSLYQSAARSRALRGNCPSLEPWPGHTAGPYGKQGNVSLKFSYLPPCIHYVLLLHLSDVLQRSRRQCPFSNSPTTAPLTVAARGALHYQPLPFVVLFIMMKRLCRAIQTNVRCSFVRYKSVSALWQPNDGKV